MNTIQTNIAAGLLTVGLLAGTGTYLVHSLFEAQKPVAAEQSYTQTTQANETVVATAKQAS